MYHALELVGHISGKITTKKAVLERFVIKENEILYFFTALMNYWICHGTFIEVIKENLWIPSLLFEDFYLLDQPKSNISSFP